MDGQIDGKIDEEIDEQMERQTDRQTEGRVVIHRSDQKLFVLLENLC